MQQTLATAASFCNHMPMIISFLESFRYVGHLWPVALLRIFAGFYFFEAGLKKLQTGFLTNGSLLEILHKWIENPGMAYEYKHFLESWVIPHVQVFSHLVVFGEIAVGISYCVGFMVRPAALGALLMNINFFYAAGPMAASINKTFIALNAVLFLCSAGRCIGFDYYFYKRVRGFWW